MMSSSEVTDMSGVVAGTGTSAGAVGGGGTEVDPELEAIKVRVKEMEEEAEKLKQMQDEVDRQMNISPNNKSGSQQTLSLEEKQEIDNRSIYVGNVDYGTTADDLERHFHGCGSVNRVTILTDKYTGHPKGFAYVEFAEKDSVQIAVALDESSFKGRLIKVCPKRTNRPGISTTNRAPTRGFGYRGRGGFGAIRSRGFGRGRGRGRWAHSPY